MNRTNHFQQRMSQRNFSEDMLSAILEFGDWNERGDQISVGRKRQAQVKELITELKREEHKIRKAVSDLERLMKREKATVVISNASLVTIY